MVIIEGTVVEVVHSLVQTRVVYYNHTKVGRIVIGIDASAAAIVYAFSVTHFTLVALQTLAFLDFIVQYFKMCKIQSC